MAGYFKVEKPTALQVADIRLLKRELEAQGYTVKVLVQHKDLDTNRTCAELSTDELQKLFTPTQPTSSKDEKIAQLEQEVADCHGMIKQLKGIVTSLIKYITK